MSDELETHNILMSDSEEEPHKRLHGNGGDSVSLNDPDSSAIIFTPPESGSVADDPTFAPQMMPNKIEMEDTEFSATSLQMDSQPARRRIAIYCRKGRKCKSTSAS